jgi:hypothetical protein
MAMLKAFSLLLNGGSNPSPPATTRARPLSYGFTFEAFFRHIFISEE